LGSKIKRIAGGVVELEIGKYFNLNILTGTFFLPEFAGKISLPGDVFPMVVLLILPRFALLQ
jgi:hypothetical protein